MTRGWGLLKERKYLRLIFESSFNKTWGERDMKVCVKCIILRVHQSSVIWVVMSYQNNYFDQRFLGFFSLIKTNLNGGQ